MSDTPIHLTPPEPVTRIAPQDAAGLTPLSQDTRAQLDARASQFVDTLFAKDPNSPEFTREVDRLTHLGQAEIDAAATQSNHFLDQPIHKLDRDGRVGRHLAELRQVIEDLDPGRQGNLSGPRRILGIIPWGGKLTSYFDRYQSAQSHIAAILAHLASGKDELLMDNAGIEVERDKLWRHMERLEQMIHIAKKLDGEIEAKATTLDATDPARAKAIRETALFYTRQRVTDLLTQMAVSVQGYLALDLVKKNNLELIKGVNRASTTTVAALRTAVTVAQALTNQRLVLKSITALNETTANVIDSTSALLKDNSAQIHKDAASAVVPLETLQHAFQNIYDTMNDIDNFKVQALKAMQTTIDTLGQEVEKSRHYLARSRSKDTAALADGESGEDSVLLAPVDAPDKSAP